MNRGLSVRSSAGSGPSIRATCTGSGPPAISGEIGVGISDGRAPRPARSISSHTIWNWSVDAARGMPQQMTSTEWLLGERGPGRFGRDGSHRERRRLSREAIVAVGDVITGTPGRAASFGMIRACPTARPARRRAGEAMRPNNHGRTQPVFDVPRRSSSAMKRGFSRSGLRSGSWWNHSVWAMPKVTASSRQSMALSCSSMLA